uniref:Rho GTPase-activating protein 44 n=1 Tax=Salarias fasciatus TaxID=181472 RepID=A0A672HA22_SALFA
MKKQFNRMRQLANQTVEKRLELLTACLQGQQGVDVDKKSKKLPLTTLAQCMVEGAAVLGDESLLGKMLKLCGETQDKLASELILFELTIERDVIEPLYDLAEVEIPNIQKQRKHLAKLVLDMDSARTRYYQSTKSSGLSSNLQPSGAKADHLREEMEEAANRMEICRDQLSADMYSFVAKEIDYASYFQTLIEVQAEYHRKSLELLQNILPQIKAHQEALLWKPLEEHLALSGRDIAFPIEACVTMLLECGMQEEGLFRVAPSASKLKKLKASLDCGVLDVQEFSADPHAIAGALKSYLHQSVPLIPQHPGSDKRLQALLGACEKLPPANNSNFKYLIKFLSKLTEYQDVNKMTPGNIAIVLGPTCSGSTTRMTTVSLQIVGIIEPITSTPTGSSLEVSRPVHTNHNSNYSSMPSPDMDQVDEAGDQSRRPSAWPRTTLCWSSTRSIRKIQSMGVRVMDTTWVSRRGSSSTRKPPPRHRPHRPPCPTPRMPPPTTSPTAPPLHQTPLVLTSPRPVPRPPRPSSARCLTVAAVSLHGCCFFPSVAKKLAPIPPKGPYCPTGAMSDQSTGQPSPVSLSPTPPSTPSPYGFSYPQGYATIGSPGQLQMAAAPSLSSPPSLAGTLTKARPTPKPPRQRPNLPPPQPPSTPGSSPQPLEHPAGLLDGPVPRREHVHR